MKICLMAIGLPGSGKTTLLKPFAKKFSLAYISRDEIRQEFFGNPIEQSNKGLVWDEANRRTVEALTLGQGVVLDSTFIDPEHRQNMIEFLRAHEVERIIGILFDVPPEVARERNKKRNQVVPDEGVDHKGLNWMQKTIERKPPNLSEGFDVLYTHEIIQDLDSVDLSKL